MIIYPPIKLNYIKKYKQYTVYKKTNMDTFEAKWVVFLDCLAKQKTTLAVSDLEAIRKALVCAKFDHVSLVQKKKRLNGYNLFMKQRMADLKESITDSNTRMGKVSDEWKKLVDADKADWKKKAAEVVSPVKEVAKVKKERKPHKMSGYQLFVSEQMPLLKEKEGVSPKERMSHIGKMWKALSEEEKKVFSDKVVSV